MSKREVKLYLTDIDDAISAIQSYTKDMTYEQLLGDRKTREAIILNFVVIGEAIKKIPQEIIARHPNVPWKEFAGMQRQDGTWLFPDKSNNHMGDEPTRSRTACGCGKSADPGICVSMFTPPTSH
jgi:hypothetical protein